MRVWLSLWILASLWIAVAVAPLGAQEAAEDDRITFNIKLEDEQGGGRLQGWAGDFEYQEGEYVLARCPYRQANRRRSGSR